MTLEEAFELAEKAEELCELFDEVYQQALREQEGVKET